MKNFYNILVLLVAFSFTTKAQYFSGPYTPFTGEFSQKPTKAAKTHVKRYNHREILEEYDLISNYSEDSLELDLVESYKHYKYTFHLNGKIKTFDRKINFERQISRFTYTEDGKILKDELLDERGKKLVETNYYYTNTDTDSIVAYRYNEVYNKMMPFHKEIIEYNSEGYNAGYSMFIYELGKYEKPRYRKYILDSKNRPLQVLDIQDKNRRLHSQYTYTDTGYKEINYKIDGTTPNDRCEYEFNEKGDLIRRSLEFWNEYQEYWILEFIEEKTYTFNTTDNERIETKSTNIIVSEGSVIVKSSYEKPYAIYSVEGKLYKQGILIDSVIRIPLNKGIYVIIVGDEKRKIFIK